MTLKLQLALKSTALHEVIERVLRRSHDDRPRVVPVQAVNRVAR